jgi:hypothetical protein
MVLIWVRVRGAVEARVFLEFAYRVCGRVSLGEGGGDGGVRSAAKMDVGYCATPLGSNVVLHFQL